MPVGVTLLIPEIDESATLQVDVDPRTELKTALHDAAQQAGIHIPKSAESFVIDDIEFGGDTPWGRCPVLEGSVIRSGSLGEQPELSLTELRIVAGPNAGDILRLSPGRLLFDLDVEGWLNFAPAPQEHVLGVIDIDWTGQAEIRPGKKGVPVHIDNEALDAPVQIRTGQQITVGSHVLEIHPVERPDGALSDTAGQYLRGFSRPPRFAPKRTPISFKLPAPVREAAKRPLPIIAAIAPLVMSIAMATMMNRPAMLLFGFLSPIIMLTNYLTDKKHGKKTHHQKVADYREHKAKVEAEAQKAIADEVAWRRTQSPDPALLGSIATGPTSQLWERRVTDEDFLTVRVGSADLPSVHKVEDPERLEHERSQQLTLPNVPALFSLRTSGVTGIVGPDNYPQATTSWIVAQLAVLHSPRDLELVILSDGKTSSEWAWAQWLPHLEPTLGQNPSALVGTSPDQIRMRLAEVTAILEARSQSSKNNQKAVFAPAVVVVFDNAAALREIPGVSKIFREGPAVGIYSICVESEERFLPEECNTVVAYARNGLTLRGKDLEPMSDLHPDLVDPLWFVPVSRSLASLRDVTAEAGSSSIPGAARLLDILDLESPTADDITRRWLRSGRSTVAVLGLGAHGPFHIDLVVDGPHGLVAGTTGSGKSELLQTVIASLAVANRPDEMNFVLIDYKGGAAFKDCVKLPHTVGMVTDLDTHLVARALESLGAELKRREEILAEAGAKDLEDYQKAQKNNPALASLPRLMIVIDEFASLKRELESFVDGLVNIAQRGRSLGIHMILATQRPSGVISADIQANTNLRIALRVTNAGESTDVINSPDAGQISSSTPGRAFARLGASSLVQFQSGRVGGHKQEAVDAKADVLATVSRPIAWTSLGDEPQPMRAKVKTAESEETDLKVLVEAICAAAPSLNLPPQHSPWLGALDTSLALDDLAARTPAGAAAFGLTDLPKEQQQRVASFSLETLNNLYIVGTARSGRSQALRTIAASLANTFSVDSLHLYGIDCGNGALLALNELPHTGAVVQRFEVERLTRLIDKFIVELERRQEFLSTRGFSDINEQRQNSALNERLPHMLILLDRWDSFIDNFSGLRMSSLVDNMNQLLKEGAGAGINIILSGDKTLLSSSMSSLVETKLVLRFSNPADYQSAGINPKDIPEEMPAGRAFLANSTVETQIALLDTDPSGTAQRNAIEAIGKRATERDTGVEARLRPFRIDTLPTEISYQDALELRAPSAPLRAVIGVGGDSLHAVEADFTAGPPTFIIGGGPRSGKSTLLKTMSQSMLEHGTKLLLITPRPSPLTALAAAPGVLGSIETATVAELDEFVAQAAGHPFAIVLDDADGFADDHLKDWFNEYIATAQHHQRAIIFAGIGDKLCTGFGSWHKAARPNNSGALLSLDNAAWGDLIGTRLPAKSGSGRPPLGQAFIHRNDDAPMLVQTPMS